MRWTATKPAAVGWYWARQCVDPESPTVVELVRDCRTNALLVRIYTADFDVIELDRLSLYDEWSDVKIPEPEQLWMMRDALHIYEVSFRVWWGQDYERDGRLLIAAYTAADALAQFGALRLDRAGERRDVLAISPVAGACPGSSAIGAACTHREVAPHAVGAVGAPQCASCRFYCEPESSRWGTCRRNPPVDRSDPDWRTPAELWPSVRSTDFCGEYQPK